jgi:1,4-dihydroxy-6-naphthoate synthase
MIEPPDDDARPVSIAFSPDSDDLFMFWALLSGRVDREGLSFTSERGDTESLNARAESGAVDVLAVSIARWASIAKDYLLLPHGMSVGRGYGPVVVAQTPRDLASLRGARIAIPGFRTTAYLVLRLLLPEFSAVVVPITPYARVFDVLRAGEVDAALIIHEGRLTYADEGFVSICDVGEAWARTTGGLPLPLGGNVIRRGLGPERVARVSRVIRSSIAWGLSHREETMQDLLEREGRPGLEMNLAKLDRYLKMYANAETLDAPADVRSAISELYSRASAAGLMPRPPAVEFAP